jgi:hypothetical protein
MPRVLSDTERLEIVVRGGWVVARWGAGPYSVSVHNRIVTDPATDETVLRPEWRDVIDAAYDAEVRRGTVAALPDAEMPNAEELALWRDGEPMQAIRQFRGRTGMVDLVMAKRAFEVSL